jgi:thymidylate synthase ThyX
MSKQPIVDPVGSLESKAILDRWMKFYISSQEAVREHLRAKYPKRPEEDEKIYEKAINARSFDIMRGFLPAGITTQLSWHTNLRQAWDKLAVLRYYPLLEVQELAEGVLAKLKEHYPNSFSHKLYDAQEIWRRETFTKHSYYHVPGSATNFSYSSNISPEKLLEYRDIITTRPQKTNLPNFLAELGNITFNFLLDFGSFRDVQRHRNGVCRMPLLTTDLGFNQWYLEQLPDNLRAQAEMLIEEQKHVIATLPASPEIKQYYTSLGFNVTCRVTYGLPAAVYVAELRSSKTVHPTLRAIAHKMIAAIRLRFPELVLHTDLDPDDWDVRRGTQDIVMKN